MRPLPRFAYPACCAAAAAAVLAAYANHFHNSFHFDDSHTVESNLFIRDLRNLPRIFTDARTFSALPANQSYRPLVTATLAVDYRFGELDPFWYHVDSFGFFLVQCALLLLFFRRLLEDRWLALFGAALYGLHGALAETVNYVIARGDILSTLGTVAALWLYAAGGRARRLHLYLVPMALGVLAKEQGAMAAPLLFLYAGLIEQRRPLRDLLRPAGFAAALRASLPSFLVCGALAVVALKMAVNFTPGGTSRLRYALTQPFVLLDYFAKFLVPLRLSADTDWVMVAEMTDLRIWIGLAFVAALLWAAWRTSQAERSRPIAFGILWFFVSLLPTSSVVPLSEVTNDHRLYFPYVGLALAAACALGLAIERLAPRLQARPALRALGVPLLLLFFAGHAAAVHARNQVWRSEETLWRDVTLKSPGNARGWMNWGLSRMGKGEFADAERAYVKSLELAPQYGYAHVNLAILLGAEGKNAEAELHFRRGLSLMPDVPVFRYFYARWLDQRGRSDEAVPLLRQCLARSPGEAAARQLLLQILARAQRWPEVAEAAREALAIKADDALALQLLQMAQRAPATPPRPSSAPTASGRAEALVDQSVKLWSEGRYEEMVAVCDSAIAVRPGYAEAWNNKCSALNQLGRFREAAAACEQALKINPDFDRARNNLAVAKQGIR